MIKSRTSLQGNRMRTYFLALILVLSSRAFAQSQSFVVDPAKSDVLVTLNTTHEVVHGKFQVESGAIQFDHTAPSISGTIVIAAGSGKTGNGSRDKKMNKDILKVDQYATVSFAPKSYAGAIAASGDSTIQVSGVLTLLGKAHDLIIPMRIHLEGSSATADCQFVIPYVQWGLKNPSFLIWKAENDVNVAVHLAGQITH
jgi:polyisoprenoid-binding protein YceI